MKKINFLMLLGGLLLIPFISSAQEGAKYPTKQITFIIPFGAGGGTDIICRTLGKIAEDVLRQPVVMENKGGGAGVIGFNIVAKAKPDGYTIGAFTYSPIIIGPHLQKMQYNIKEDFSFIGQMATYAHAVVVKADAPWKTFKEFIEDVRKNPGKRTHGSAGVKQVQHINFQEIARVSNVKLRHVPYTSGAQLITSVLGGHVDASISANVTPHIKSGALRALAVTSLERWESLPEVPTLRELGYLTVKPTWLGVGGPKGIPKEVMEKLEKAFEKAAKDPLFIKTMTNMEMVPSYLSGEEFKKIVFSDYDAIGEMLKNLPLD